MEIKTKFDLGNRVWVMKDNKCYDFIIKDINIEIKRCPTCDIGKYFTNTQLVKYQGYETKWYNEDELFSSKEELIASL